MSTTKMIKKKKKKCACNGSTLTRFIQPVILIALMRESDHGYSLLNKIGQTRLWQDKKPDPSGLYRVLKTMESRGLLHSDAEAAEEDNMGKRIYNITAEGRDCLRNWKKTLEDYQLGIAEIVEGIDEVL